MAENFSYAIFLLTHKTIVLMKKLHTQNRYLSIVPITIGAVRKVFLITLLLVGFIATHQVHAQSCLMNTLNISTGYNPTTGTYLGIHSPDPEWKQCYLSPDLYTQLNDSGYATAGGPYMITRYIGWTEACGPGEWLNCVDTTQAHMAVGDSLHYSAVFSRSFTLCCAAKVCIVFNMAGDDTIRNVHIDGAGCTEGGFTMHTIPVGGISYTTCVLIDTCMDLSAGTHTIYITVGFDNIGDPNPNGIYVSGSVSSYGSSLTLTPALVSESAACAGYSCMLPPILGTKYVCDGFCTTLADSQAGGVWTSGNTAVATIGASTGIFCGVTTGTAIITYTVGCLTATTVVTVEPIPTLNVTPLCVGSYETITVLPVGASGGTWISGTTTVATVGLATGIAYGVDSGQTIINYTSPYGCVADTI